MSKFIVILLFMVSLGFFVPVVYAEVYLNFDSEIRDVSWDYRPIDERLVFSVNVFNILDIGNYIVHLEIEPENNDHYPTQKNLLQIETGHSRSVDLSYEIKTMDNLSVKTWINPPRNSANPLHEFDESKLSISSDEMWKKVKDAVKGIPLVYDVIADENSDLHIEIKDLSLEAKDKGIRIMYSGNLEMCDTFSFESENYTMAQFSGHSFFDRTVDFSRHAVVPDFHIVCNTLERDEIHISPDLEIFKQHFALAQVSNSCTWSICIFPPVNSPVDGFPLGELLGAITAVIVLVGILIKFNWIPLKKRQEVSPNKSRD
jgi:hypothetical protein